MNTAACCPTPSIVPTTRSPFDRGRLWLADAWQAWRQRSRQHAEQRALDAMSASTLRDLGLAERVADRPVLPVFDYERGRW